MSDTDSNKGCGSPESVADSEAADQQATEIEQLKKQLEAANLQIRDKDNRLAAADADHHNLQEQLQHMQQGERHCPLSAGKSTDQAAWSSTYICLQSCARSATSGTLIRLQYWKWLISGTGASSLQQEVQQ